MVTINGHYGVREQASVLSADESGSKLPPCKEVTINGTYGVRELAPALSAHKSGSKLPHSKRGDLPAKKPFDSRIRPNRLEVYRNPLADPAQGFVKFE